MIQRVPHAPAARLAVSLLLGTALLGACNPPPETGRPGSTTLPGETGGGTSSGGAPSGGGTPPGASQQTGGGGGEAVAEPGVISGRVSLENGAPVAGASLRIVGYTGGAALGREIETVTSGTDGTYRYEVPSGLYEVLGEGPLDFEGETFRFLLDPADESCEQEMSDAGIVKDFVLRLTGLQQCLDGVNPNNHLFYHGAAIQVFSGLTSAAPHDVVEYALQPVGALADGTTVDTPFTVHRTVAAHSNFSGPIGDTNYVYDIPLGRYLVSAALLAPDGRRLPLLVSSTESPTPAQSVEVSFDPRVIVGTPAVGYSSIMPSITVSEGG